MNSLLIILRQFEEAVGVLHNLSQDGCVLVAKIGELNIVLPIEMDESLRSLISQKIGILRTDDHRYLVRVIPNPAARECLEGEIHA